MNNINKKAKKVYKKTHLVDKLSKDKGTNYDKKLQIHKYLLNKTNT